jgi:hypothetical protein
MRRVLLVITACLLMSAAVLALVVIANQGLELSGCVAAMPLGWAAVIVSSLVIAVVGGVLFITGKRIDEGSRLKTVECRSCAGAVLEEWRICPYCGADTGTPYPVADPAQPADPAHR